MTKTNSRSIGSGLRDRRKDRRKVLELAALDLGPMGSSPRMILLVVGYAYAVRSRRSSARKRQARTQSYIKAFASSAQCPCAPSRNHACACKAQIVSRNTARAAMRPTAMWTATSTRGRQQNLCNILVLRYATAALAVARSPQRARTNVWRQRTFPAVGSQHSFPFRGFVRFTK